MRPSTNVQSRTSNDFTTKETLHTLADTPQNLVDAYDNLRRATDRVLVARHKIIVDHISKQISAFHEAKTPFRIFHGSTNSTRQSTRTKTASVDTSDLNHVLHVSLSDQTCLVEPNVPMDALVRETLRYGLVPPVVPEFPGITVGGGFAGTAGESSSFRHGFFDAAVTSLEVVLADGTIAAASKVERNDLFEGLKGTFGSLGVATCFEMRLIPAKKYVELRYMLVDRIEDAQDTIKETLSQSDVDFVDGIMFGPDRGVVLVGQMVDQDEKYKDTQVTTFHKAWDQWFYLHVEEQLQKAKARPEVVRYDLIPLESYLFRYDRGAFWTGRFAYTYFLVPFIRPMRWLADYFMHTRIMYHALHRSGLYQRFIIQDMALPNKNMPDFSHWLDEELPHVYPRWLCPLKPGEGVSMNPHLRNNERDPKDEFANSLLNIGIWGETPRNALQVTINRQIEAKLKSLSGMKWLYAQTFYTEEEFWNIYDKSWYDNLRQKHGAEGYIPSVYDKICTKNIFEDVRGDNGKIVRKDARLPVEKGIWRIWPLAGVYGVLSALKGGDYLRKK